MIVALHKTADNRRLMSVCDNDLIGKVFEEKDVLLDLKSGFYKGHDMPEEEIVELFESCFFITFVGKDSVALALKRGLVEKERIVMIKKIPYAMSLSA